MLSRFDICMARLEVDLAAQSSPSGPAGDQAGRDEHDAKPTFPAQLPVRKHRAKARDNDAA